VLGWYKFEWDAAAGLTLILFCACLLLVRTLLRIRRKFDCEMNVRARSLRAGTDRDIIVEDMDSIQKNSK